MLQKTIIREQAFELNRTRNRWTIPTGGAEIATIGGQAHSTWTTAEITFYRSHDGVTPDTLEDPVVLGPPTPSYGTTMSVTVDCAGYPFLIGIVTQTEGADRLAALSANLSSRLEAA